MIYKFERKLKGANQVEATGEELTINNAGRKVQKFELSGRSEQKARSGYNLANLDADSFVKNGVTVTNNGDGSWTFNGTSTQDTDLILTKNIELTKKIYQFEEASYLLKTIVMSGNFSNPNDVTVRTLGMGQDDGVNNFFILNNELKNGEFSKIFNKQATSHLSRLELFCGANVTFNNYTVKILFAKTENKELEWEQYGVSPSLEFLSEVENLEGKNKYYIPNTGKVKSNGITATYTKNTSEIILDGVATRDFSDGFEIKNILLKKGTYSASIWGLNKIDEEYDRFFVADASNNNKVIVNYVQSYRTQKFTLKQDTNIKLAFIIKAGSTYSNTKVKIMINEGDIGLSYVPYNSFKIRQTGKNILPDNRDDYNGSVYGYIKLLNNFENNNLVLSIEDNDKSIDMTGIFFGVTGNGKNWDNLGIWLLNNGHKIGNSISTNQYSFFSFYPNNQTTFDKIFKRYKIQAEISKDTVPTEWEKYKSNSWIFPLELGQKLYEGSYLAEDGIHNIKTQIKLLSSDGNLFESSSGTYKVFGRTQKGVKRGSQLLSNYFKDNSSVNTLKENVGIANNNTADRIYISNGISTTLDEFKDWLDECENAGTPMKVEYELATEEIISYTQEQQEIYSQLQNLELFRGCNHITVESNVKPTIKLSYYDGELDMTDYKYNLQFKKHMQEM